MVDPEWKMREEQGCKDVLRFEVSIELKIGKPRKK